MACFTLFTSFKFTTSIFHLNFASTTIIGGVFLRFDVLGRKMAPRRRNLNRNETKEIYKQRKGKTNWHVLSLTNNFGRIFEEESFPGDFGSVSVLKVAIFVFLSLLET